MKPCVLLLLLVSLLFAQENCQEKRERIKALETEQKVEQAGEVLSWMRLTRPTSSNKKQLDQQIRVLKLEIQQCELENTQHDHDD